VSTIRALSSGRRGAFKGGLHSRSHVAAAACQV
jgi:hypothetical protein